VPGEAVGESPLPPTDPPEARIWVTQEGLTNVEKHAQAREVVVTLSLQPQLAVLRVGGDGGGQPPDAEGKPGHYESVAFRGGFGIKRERAPAAQ